MATQTPNLGLKKPAGSDFVRVNDFNENSDVLDGAIGKPSSLQTTDRTNLVAAINEARKTSDEQYAPYVGANGNWYEWDVATSQFVDTGKTALGVCIGPSAPSDGYYVWIDTSGNPDTVVTSVNNIQPDANGDVDLGAPNYEYSGRDLSQIYTAAELHAKVAAGDFSGVRIGDYWSITLTGTYYDYAESASKTLANAVMKMEVAGIDTFLQYGDTAPVLHHLVMVSRDCLPNTMKMRSEDTTWYNATATNPWLGSAAYETFNNETNGLINLVAATPIGAYIYAGANAKGMRFLGETKASGATAAASWAWLDRGKLWLPTEREVWGQDVWSEHGFGNGASIQHPIFQGGLRHIIKGLGNGGSRNSWWCSSSYSGSAAWICLVSRFGYAGAARASGAYGVPLCFLLS